MVKHFCCVSCRRCLPFIKISVYFLSQWWSHLPYLPWRRQQRGSPVSMRLHRHFGYSAQELLREVAVVLQHQLLWALPHGVQHRAPTEAPHRGNKGQCPLPCLQQSFFSSFLFIVVGLLVVNECVCMKVWWCFLSVFFLFYISLLACFFVNAECLFSSLASFFLPGFCHSLTSFCFSSLLRLTPQWLRDPGPRNEKRTLFCDMVCFLFITPLAAISGWLCLRGAQDHLQLRSWLQAVGLIALTIALFTIYVLWTLVKKKRIPIHYYCKADIFTRKGWCIMLHFGFLQVSFRYHCQLYSEWRRTNQKVRLLIPAAKESNSSQHSLLSNKLMKKSASESIVWDQTEIVDDYYIFYVWGLIPDASCPQFWLWRNTCGDFFCVCRFFFLLFFFFAPWAHIFSHCIL